jgi:phosphoglycerate-specific signal transduction histidine kinase
MVEMSALPEEYFSKEEAEQLQERLTDLEKRLTENLSQNVKDNKELSAKIESVRSDIQMLKDNVQNLTKPKLMTALLARTFDWLKDPVNRKLITSGAQVAKDILLESGHHSATGQ